MTADAVGGVWTYCVELAAALAPHGVEVHVATMGPPPSADQREEAGVFAALHESTFPLEWTDDPWAGVDEAASWLLGLDAAVRPHVVHLNGYVHAALPWSAPTVVVAHSDVVSWWQAVHGTPPPPSWDTYRRRVRDGLHAAACVVAPTRAVSHDLARAYGVHAASVVPNCRRPDVVAPAAVTEPLVLAAGRAWDRAKGIDALVRVAPRVPAPVVVAGHGAPERGAGEATDHAPVRWLGPLPFPELAQWLARAAVYAAPARYEPFGLGILEAAVAGCALVLGDLPSLREVWGPAALYVRDDDELAAALTGLVEDPDRAAARGAAARQRGLEYSPERTGAGYLELYAALPVASGGAR